MERWIQLWILSLVAGTVAQHFTGIRLFDGIWKAPATLPCVYEPSSDLKQLKVTWKISRPSEAPRTILYREASEDHILLHDFRDRVHVAKLPPGDVSLHIKKLEMTDIGSFVCLVELEDQNMRRSSIEKTIQLKVVKVPASKPVIESNIPETIMPLPSGIQINLTCSANGSPLISYQWYKDVPGGEAEALQRGRVLTFKSLQLSDSARYFCTAQNRLNKQEERSDVLHLRVKAETETPETGTTRRPDTTHNTTAPGAQKISLPLYVIILIAVLPAAFILIVISLVFCRRRTKPDNIYKVSYNNNALTLEGNGGIPASPGVNSICLYEEPYSYFGNNYTMEPTKADEYVTMGDKMDNQYETLVTEKPLGK